MSKGGSPPPAPDYVGAAVAQGAANVDAAKVQGKINNPNVVNPYGTQTVQWGGVNQSAYDTALNKYNTDLSTAQSLRDQLNALTTQPTDGTSAGTAARQAQIQDLSSQINSYAGLTKPTTNQFMLDENSPLVTQTLSPEQQALYNQQVGNQQGLGSLANQGIGAAQGIIGSKLDYSGAPAAPGDYNTLRSQVYDAMMARPNEDLGIKRDNTNSDLIAAGIRPGSKAYDNQMNLINRQQNDAQQQAIINAGNQTQQAYGMDMQSRQQGLTEELAKRQVPLNEITALMSGSQTSNPFQMPGYAQNANVQAAPVYNAAQQAGQYGTDVYNANQARNSANTAGLVGLGGTALMAGAMMF
jgi:hypothetical protein